MTLLDFSEIPPSIPPSARLEAFEDFAKSFFERLYKAKIEKNPARGSDDGVDVIANVAGERWLISCKHWTSSINREDDPRGRLDQHKCQRFIGFYSPGPSAALERKLRSIFENHSEFTYEIKNASDIEAELMSSQSADGWHIAFRHFPSSYTKIASSLVRPIEQVTEQDVMVRSMGEINQHYLPGLGASVLHAKGHADKEKKASRIVAKMANEAFSGHAFDPIFVSRAADYAKLLPGAFVKMRGVSDSELSASKIYPSWRLSLLEALKLPRHPLSAVYDLCRLWSFWCPRTAKLAMTYAQLRRNHHEIAASWVDPNAYMWWSDPHFTDILENPGDQWSYAVKRSSEILTIGEIGSDGHVATRGYFAALLCYRPLGLSRYPDPAQAYCHLAKLFDEENALNELVGDVVKELSKDDQAYVNRSGRNLTERLMDLNSALLGLNVIQHRGGHLRCVTECAVENWIPNKEADPSLIDALGL